MTTTYLAIQAPNDLYYVITRCGVVAINGTLETYDNLTGLPKPTYRDPFKQIPNDTVIRLGSNGSPGYPIYWDTLTSLYKIIVRDASGNIIDDNDNYPILTQSTSSGAINLTLDASNFSLNPQFYFWSDKETYTNDLLPIGSTPIADEWYFTRSNTAADITISRALFPAGDTLVPGTSPAYLLYTVNTAAADSSNDIGQRYENVQTLNNTIVTESMYFQSALIGDTATVDLLVRQVFGDGGSTTVETPIASFVIDDTMQPFSSTFTIPNISGLTIGTGSYLEIFWRLNPAQTQSIKIADNRFQKGAGTGNKYPYVPLDQQQAQILPYNLEQYGPEQGTHIIASPAGADPGEGPSLYNYLETQAQPTYLIGWYFASNPNQMGTPNTATSAYPNVDGGYIADMTILQSDGDNIVEKTSFINDALSLNVVTAGKKFGVGQIIELSNCQSLFNIKVSSYFVATSATLTSSCKFAIIGWNGAGNMESRQFVAPGAWQAAGTNPTLKSGWNYLTVQDFTLGPDGSSSFGQIDGFTMPAPTSYSVFAVFWWIDDLAATTSDSVQFGYANLTKTGIASLNVVPETLQQTLIKCQRYFYKTYDTESPDIIVTNLGEALSFPIQITLSVPAADAPADYPSSTQAYVIPITIGRGQDQAVGLWAGVNTYFVEFPFEMATTPTINIYNAVGAAPDTGFNAYSYTGPYSVTVNTFIAVPLAVTYLNRKNLTLSSELASVQLVTGGGIITFATGVNTNFNIIADAQLGV